MDEQIDVLRRLWTGEAVDVEGRSMVPGVRSPRPKAIRTSRFGSAPGGTRAASVARCASARGGLPPEFERPWPGSGCVPAAGRTVRRRRRDSGFDCSRLRQLPLALADTMEAAVAMANAGAGGISGWRLSRPESRSSAGRRSHGRFSPGSAPSSTWCACSRFDRDPAISAVPRRGGRHAVGSAFTSRRSTRRQAAHEWPSSLSRGQHHQLSVQSRALHQESASRSRHTSRALPRTA